MDPTLKNSRHQELYGLISALCDDALSEAQERRLAELLESDATAQQALIESMNLEMSLQYWCDIEGFLQQSVASETNGQPTVALVNERRVALGNKSVAWCVALFGTAVMLACLAFGWWLGARTTYLANRSETTRDAVALNPEVFHPELRRSNPPIAPPPINPRQFGPPDVDAQAALENGFTVCGRIVRFSPGSEWSGEDLAIMQGTYLRPGQLLTLNKGLAEIQFSAGGIAILQGPTTFRIHAADAGYLQEGKLTAMVRGDSPGLTVRTPSSWYRVADGRIGTTVSKAGVADVQVLSGSITAGLVDRAGAVVSTCSLTKGNTIRFNASTELLSRIAFVADDYVLELPESFIAYQNLAGMDGNQNEFGGSLGMDFVVKDPIAITKLGVFDSKADGLKRTITAQLWMRDEAGTPYHFHDDFPIAKLIELKFTPEDSGKLVESNRFKSLEKPLVLTPGAYTIVAYGYGEGEPNGNEGNVRFDEVAGKNVMVMPGLMAVPKPLRFEHGADIPTNALKRLDDGGGTVLFVGTSRYDGEVGRFPRILDTGSVNRYRAGTFEFERIRWDDVQDSGRWLQPRDASDLLRPSDKSI